MSNDARKPAKAVLAAFTFLMVGYAWLIVKGHNEVGGASPDQQVLGTTADIDQRAMEQYCTGVVVTPESTWLVGRREGALGKFAFARNVPDLSALFEAPAAAEAAGEDSSLLGYRSLFASRPSVSFVSRLNSEGRFVPVAVVPEVACLRATPDGKRVFLLTGLDRPDRAQGGVADQDAIFQSDDQGRSWQWRKEGLFPETETLAWSLDIRFGAAASAWAWGQPQSAFAYGEAGEPHESTRLVLQYSPDGGDTIEAVTLSAPLLVRLDDVRHDVPADAVWGDANGTYGTVKHHVVQLDADDAMLWVSQWFRYAPSGGPYLTHSLRVNHVASLHRENGRWQMGPVARKDGIGVEWLADNGAGRIVATVEDDDGLNFALLDRDTLEWKIQGALPGAFDPLPNRSSVREIHLGRDTLVVNVMSDHTVPRWLYPWGREAVSISGDAVFYSTDWGRSWSRLAIDGYLGVLGMDAAGDRVVFAKGNWYDSDDLRVFSYGLR